MKGTQILYKRFPRFMFHVRRLGRANYEKEMRLLDVLCSDAKTSVDVGAKLGMYTYRLLRHSRDVVAFEPIPLLGGMLKSVFRERCRIEPYALSDTSGETMLRVPHDSRGEVKFGRSTIEPNNELTHDDIGRIDEITVQVRMLDEYQLKNVGFMKIDVEGHEISVLGGAKETLHREKPNLLIEANNHHHPGAVSRVREVLHSQDYEGFFVDGASLVELANLNEAEHLESKGIENFIFVHRSKSTVREQLLHRVPLAR